MPNSDAPAPRPFPLPCLRCLLCLLCAVCLWGLAACSGGSEEQITLLTGYDFGMRKSDVASRAGAATCPDDAERLCRRQPTMLFKIYWEQRFRFKNDKLVAVELRHSNSKEVQATIDGWLDGGYRYMPMLVKSEGQELDILAALRQYGKDVTRQAVRQFVKAMPLTATTTYIYGDFKRKNHLLTNARSHADLMARAPRDFILIEESVSDDAISLTFRAPVAEK